MLDLLATDGPTKEDPLSSLDISIAATIDDDHSLVVCSTVLVTHTS